MAKIVSKTCRFPQCRKNDFFSRHYGEGPDTEWGPEADRKSTKVIEDILGWENPDFVVFTGDQISGEVMYANATDYIGILLKPVVEKGYRFVFF